jgi:hypothetical protein
MVDGDQYIHLGIMSMSEKEVDKYWNRQLPISDRVGNFYRKNIKSLFNKKKTIESSV